MILENADAGTCLAEVSVVDSTAEGFLNPEPGVRVITLEEFWKGREAVTFKRVNTKKRCWWNWGENRSAIIAAAVEYALAQEGDPYDWRFKKYDQDAHYCSELVWHAYHEGPPEYAELHSIDLDSNGGSIVTPDDLYSSWKLDSIYYWHE